MKNLLVLALLAGATNVAIGAEVIVTQAEKAGGTSENISLDVMTDGETSAVNFRLQLQGPASSIDTSACLRELPKSHQGMCEANPKNGRVSVVVWSMDNTPLPAGIVGLGRIGVKYGAASRADQDRGVAVDRAFAAGPAGQASEMRATGNDGRDASRRSTTIER